MKNLLKLTALLLGMFYTVSSYATPEDNVSQTVTKFSEYVKSIQNKDIHPRIISWADEIFEIKLTESKIKHLSLNEPKVDDLPISIWLGISKDRYKSEIVKIYKKLVGESFTEANLADFERNILPNLWDDMVRETGRIKHNVSLDAKEIGEDLKSSHSLPYSAVETGNLMKQLAYIYATHNMATSLEDVLKLVAKTHNARAASSSTNRSTSGKTAKLFNPKAIELVSKLLFCNLPLEVISEYSNPEPKIEGLSFEEFWKLDQSGFHDFFFKSYSNSVNGKLRPNQVTFLTNAINTVIWPKFHEMKNTRQEVLSDIDGIMTRNQMLLEMLCDDDFTLEDFRHQIRQLLIIGFNYRLVMSLKNEDKTLKKTMPSPTNDNVTSNDSLTFSSSQIFQFISQIEEYDPLIYRWAEKAFNLGLSENETRQLLLSEPKIGEIPISEWLEMSKDRFEAECTHIYKNLMGASCTNEMLAKFKVKLAPVIWSSFDAEKKQLISNHNIDSRIMGNGFNSMFSTKYSDVDIGNQMKGVGYVYFTKSMATSINNALESCAKRHQEATTSTSSTTSTAKDLNTATTGGTTTLEEMMSSNLSFHPGVIAYFDHEVEKPDSAKKLMRMSSHDPMLGSRPFSTWWEMDQDAFIDAVVTELKKSPQAQHLPQGIIDSLKNEGLMIEVYRLFDTGREHIKSNYSPPYSNRARRCINSPKGQKFLRDIELSLEDLGSQIAQLQTWANRDSFVSVMQESFSNVFIHSE